MLTHYYARTGYQIAVALLDMFNDMRVVKYDKDGNAVSEYPVYITYAPRDKVYDDRTENNYVDASNVQHGERYFLKTPRISIKPTGIVRDAVRAKAANQWRYWKTGVEISDSNLYKVLSDYEPTPYNFGFEVAIMTRSMDYFYQIIENILPYFNDKMVLRVKEFSFLNIERDLQVSMDGLNLDFSDEMGEFDIRECNGTINFNVEGYLYRPFVWSNVIKIINSDYFVGDATTEQVPLVTSYHTSAYATSAGNIIETSAVPPVSAYTTSGTFDDTNKSFVWFSSKKES